MIKKFYNKLTFLQGVALTICLTSIISIAATNLPGLFIFSPGTPISSSEVNTNFEKLAGNIVLKANMSTTLLISNTNGNYTTLPDCTTCNIYRKKLLLDTVLINDGNFKVATDSDPNSSAQGSSFSYYEVTTSGWYELQFIPNINISMSTPTITGTSNCNHSVYSSFTMLIGANNTSFSGYNSGFWFSQNKSDNDTNCDGTVESSYDNSSPPEMKKVYLKAGQVVFFKYESSYNEQGETANYSSEIPANSLDITIIKL